MSKSVVHGDAEFNVGDYLKEGAQDTNTTADPLAEGAFQIKATFKTPSPDGRYYVYGAMLV